LSVLSYVRSTLHLQMFVDNNAFAHNPSPGLINASLWSISVEFWFYIVVLVLGLIGILRKRFVALGILAAILPIQIFIYRHHIDYGTKTFDIFMLFPLFLAGSLAYLFSKEISFRLRYAVLAILVLFGSLHVPYATDHHLPNTGSLPGDVADLPAGVEPSSFRKMGRFFLRHLSLCLPDPATSCALLFAVA
jgi:peptidoglycan/LPS O-acetylase OafA/YrhL